MIYIWIWFSYFKLQMKNDKTIIQINVGPIYVSWSTGDPLIVNLDDPVGVMCILAILNKDQSNYSIDRY